MTTMRHMLLPALASAIWFANAGPAAAYTYTFRLPMTINDVHMHTVSAFCRDVGWSGEANSGTTLTLNSASICLVDQIVIQGKYNGQPATYTFNIRFGAPSATVYDRDGNICVDTIGQSFCQPWNLTR